MDVKRFTQSARFGSLALALFLGQASLARAEVAVASDSEVTSTIYITDAVASEPPKPPQSVAGSVVIVEDTPSTASASVTFQPAKDVSLPKLQEPRQSSARGDIKVITNQQPQASLQASRPLPKQKPLAPIVQLQAVASLEREQPGDIQIAVHSESVVPKSETLATDSPTEIASADRLLVAAHQLSLEAKTVAEYSQIIQDTADALRLGARGEKHGFARHLSSWALNRRGQLRSDDGEQKSASADFQTALDFNSKNWRALHNRGVSFAQSGNFVEAFDDFNAVLQLNPNYAKAYTNRATLYVQAKEYPLAVQDYEQAIHHDPKFATAYVGLGRVCHMLSRWEEAIQHFTSAMQLEPTSPNMVCSRGDLHADMGHYGEALADYARTIELDTKFAHAYRNGAWLLATCPDERFRDPENAILGARQALEYSYGEKHIALDTLAAALASDGQFKEAIATVNEAVELAPKGPRLAYRSRLQLYQGNEPFRTEPVGEVSQVVYEVSDK